MSNEAKFTKGPWIPQIDSEFFNEVGPKNTTQSFANVHANKILKMSQEECDANTHLIAAAPEMYELLDRLSPMLTEINAHALSSEVDALLAKARGEK